MRTRPLQWKVSVGKSAGEASHKWKRQLILPVVTDGVFAIMAEAETKLLCRAFSASLLTKPTT